MKIQTQYTNIKEFIKEGPLKIGKSVLTFEGNEGQRSDIWSQEHGAEQGEAELRTFNLSSDLRQILRYFGTYQTGPKQLCVST